MLSRRISPALRPWPRAARRQLHPRRAQSSEAASKVSRIDRITSRLPRRLQPYTNGLRNAPVSHVVSFLILHELTAIVPLLALFGVFHYTDYVPVAWMTEHLGSYVESSVAKFERYFSRKGWFGFGQDSAGTGSSSGGERAESKDQTQEALERFQDGEQKYRVLVEVALAYAVTKVALPVRIIASVWATPWFAGLLVRARGTISRKL